MHFGTKFAFLLWAPCVFLAPAQDPSSKTSDPVAQAKSVYSQGIQALQQGDLDSAQAAFEKVVRLAPKIPEGHNSLGWVLLARDQVEPAIHQFQTAIKLKPDFSQAHINLSNAFVRKGDASGAVRESREAVRLAPADSESRRTLAHALDFSGQSHPP